MRILVAFDGSAGAHEALAVADDIAAPAEGELVVCWVLSPQDASAGAEGVEQAQSTIEDALTDLEAGAIVRVESVERGEDIAAHLARVAGDEEATLLAIATRSSSGDRGGMGSVAQEVLRLSPCPVVVVRPTEDS